MLHDSGFDSIEPHAFDNLSSLVALDLSNNAITSLIGFATSYLPSLRKLSLAKNQLSVAKEVNEVLTICAPNLEVLDLRENPWIVEGQVFREESVSFFPHLRALDGTRIGAVELLEDNAPETNVIPTEASEDEHEDPLGWTSGCDEPLVPPSIAQVCGRS